MSYTAVFGGVLCDSCDDTRDMYCEICVLQCVAVCCSVLQCVAVCCSVLQLVMSYMLRV